MEKEFIELLTLQNLMKTGLEEMFPDKLWVRAEISAISVKANGHCYMELCQSGPSGVIAKVRAVIWRTKYNMLHAFFREATGSELKAGITVLFRVQVSYSELYGLSLTIDDIDPQFTLGEKEMEKRKTIAKLAQEGLINAQKELCMSSLPYMLAVISAQSAAGYGDFCRHLHENEFGFVLHTDLFEATMQGNGAPESIISALDVIESCGVQYDAILILRGGGSALDLDCFNDYDMCRRIALCNIPVLTAIGHDRDFHVADMVAMEYVKTPTALADLLLDCYMTEDERISSYSSRLRTAFLNKISNIAGKVDLLEARIKGADPRNILSRGYLIAADEDGTLIKKASEAHPGEHIRVMFADGTLECEVIATDLKP